jgi:hypothetical protein
VSGNKAHTLSRRFRNCGPVIDFRPDNNGSFTRAAFIIDVAATSFAPGMVNHAGGVIPGSQIDNPDEDQHGQVGEGYMQRGACRMISCRGWLVTICATRILKSPRYQKSAECEEQAYAEVSHRDPSSAKKWAYSTIVTATARSPFNCRSRVFGIGTSRLSVLIRRSPRERPFPGAVPAAHCNSRLLCPWRHVRR